MLGSIPFLMAASAMQMVLVLGATSKVSGQNSRTVQASGVERTLTDLHASTVKTATQGVFTCALGGCAHGVAMSVHFFVIAGDFWYASVLVDNVNASFAGAMQAFLGVLYAGMDAGQGLADLGNGKWCLPRHVRPHGPQVSGEWVGTCWGHAHVAASVLSVDLAKCVDTHDSLQRHTLGDAVQSGFRGSCKTGLTLVRSTQTAWHRCLCSASYPQE